MPVPADGFTRFAVFWGLLAERDWDSLAHPAKFLHGDGDSFHHHDAVHGMSFAAVSRWRH